MGRELPTNFDLRRFYFPSQTAPFGEMNFIRHDYITTDLKQQGIEPDVNLALTATGIIQNAVLNSHWLTDSISSTELTRFASIDYWQPLLNHIKRDINISATDPSKISTWFAIEPAHFAEKSKIKYGIADNIESTQIVGYTALEQISKYSQSADEDDETYQQPIVHIDNLVVKASHQHHNIGAALLYFSLSNYSLDQKLTTNVPFNYLGIIKKLSELSFTKVGRHTSRELLPSYSVDLNTVAAINVNIVKYCLLDKYPWLSKAINLA